MMVLCYIYYMCVCIQCIYSYIFIGEKLPILFVLKAQPGGTIESKETLTYPKGNYYRVQRNAWMDGRAWSYYLNNVLK